MCEFRGSKFVTNDKARSRRFFHDSSINIGNMPHIAKTAK